MPQVKRGTPPTAAFKKALTSRPEVTDPHPEAKTFVEAWAEGPSVDSAIEEIDSEVPMLPLSGEHPEMPRRLDEVGDADLSQLIAHMAAYSAFYQEKAAGESGLAAELEAYLEGREAEVSLARGGTVLDKKNRATVHPELATIRHRLLVSQAKARLLDARSRGYEKMGAALSRELTRRLTSPPSR